MIRALFEYRIRLIDLLRYKQTLLEFQEGFEVKKGWLELILF